MRLCLPSNLKIDFYCMATIALVGVVLYGHSLHVPWYMDDYPAILDQPLVRDLGASLRQISTRRGVATFTFALNHRFGGLDPAGYHMGNIAIHLLTSSLVYLLLKRVLPGRRLWSLLGALIFVAHPLQTQAVTYVVQRMTSLCGLFFFLSLYLFVRARESLAAGGAFRAPRHLTCYLGSIAAGALSLYTKEIAAVLPLALLLFARFFLPADRSWRPLLGYLAPFLLAPVWLTANLLVIPLLQGEKNTLSTLAATSMVQVQPDSPLHYLVTEFSVIWGYIRLLFLPWGQALHHHYPIVDSLLTFRNAIAATGLAAMGWVAIWLRHRQPLIAFGIAWFFLTLAVESTLIPLDPFFEHRLYLPMFGFATVLLGVAQSLPQPRIGTAMLCVVIGLFSPLTWHRNSLWNDPAAFFEDNLRTDPGNPRAMSDLAQNYMNYERYAEAEALLTRALDRYPFFLDGYLTLSSLYLQTDRLIEGVELLDRALKNFPFSKRLIHQLALFAIKIGDIDKAVYHLRIVVAIDSENADGHKKLGQLLASQQNFGEAEAHLRRAVSLFPDDVEARDSLAGLLRWQGRLQEAREEWLLARRFAPDNPGILMKLGEVSIELGDRFAAQEVLQRLQPIDPAAAADLQRAIASGTRQPSPR